MSKNFLPSVVLRLTLAVGDPLLAQLPLRHTLALVPAKETAMPVLALAGDTQSRHTLSILTLMMVDWMMPLSSKVHGGLNDFLWWDLGLSGHWTRTWGFGKPSTDMSGHE